MSIERKINLDATRKSVLLLGPRQTGKTWYLRHQFPDYPYYNLLHSDVFLRFSSRPSSLREELLVSRPKMPIIIDEIQKMPQFLDEIQAMIDELDIRFILTGSSARKLKRTGVNLLGGRARIRTMHPLSLSETGEQNISRVLHYGNLPSIYLSDSPWDDLRSYCGVYLQQEIADEGISRNIEAFARFLHVAALMNGELLNFEALASDAAVPARTVREYYSVLQDTLIGELVEPWKIGKKRKPISSGKFYFFDLGVRNALTGDKDFPPGGERWGKSLEHLIYTELRAYLNYHLDDRALCFWRTRCGNEVDFIVGNDIAIEVKASVHPSEKHLVGLKRIKEEGDFKKRVLVCQAECAALIDGVEILPVRMFIDQLWQEKLI